MFQASVKVGVNVQGWGHQPDDVVGGGGAWGGVFLLGRMACGCLLGDKERFTMQQRNQSVFTPSILSSSDVITSLLTLRAAFALCLSSGEFSPPSGEAAG